jgi:hypothetical protein
MMAGLVLLVVKLAVTVFPICPVLDATTVPSLARISINGLNTVDTTVATTFVPVGTFI